LRTAGLLDRGGLRAWKRIQPFRRPGRPAGMGTHTGILQHWQHASAWWGHHPAALIPAMHAVHGGDRAHALSIARARARVRACHGSHMRATCAHTCIRLHVAWVIARDYLVAIARGSCMWRAARLYQLSAHAPCWVHAVASAASTGSRVSLLMFGA
jgi:hypothetical protein